MGLSPRDIDLLIDRVGSHTLVALATDSETRTNPLDWAKGTSTPDDDQMERLVVIKEVMDIASRRQGAQMARSWFIGANCCNMTMSPAEVIRHGDYDEARASARRFHDDTWN